MHLLKQNHIPIISGILVAAAITISYGYLPEKNILEKQTDEKNSEVNDKPVNSFEVSPDFEISLNPFVLGDKDEKPEVLADTDNNEQHYR